MKAFLEQYGTAIFVLVVVAILVAFANPVGTLIKDATNKQISNVDSLGTNAINETVDGESSGGGASVQAVSRGNYRHTLADGTVEDHDTTDGTCSVCQQKVLAPGLYDEEDNQIYSWDELLNYETNMMDTTLGTSTKVKFYSLTNTGILNSCYDISMMKIATSTPYDGHDGCKLIMADNVKTITYGVFAKNTPSEIVLPKNLSSAEFYFNTSHSVIMTVPESITNKLYYDSLANTTILQNYTFTFRSDDTNITLKVPKELQGYTNVSFGTTNATIQYY